MTNLNFHIFYTYKRLRPRKKNPQQKKRKSRYLLTKLNTKPLKFKCGLADGGWGGRGAGWRTLARHG
jgi:hypothetical protein